MVVRGGYTVWYAFVPSALHPPPTLEKKKKNPALPTGFYFSQSLHRKQTFFLGWPELRGKGPFTLYIPYSLLRPPLRKNRFLWAGWAKKKPVGRSGIFFAPNFIFYKLECTGGESKKKKKKKRK